MLPIFPCSARISSSCVSARSNRKSGYPHTHTHTRTRLDYAIECTAHVPPPRSRDTYYKFKLYLWPPWTAPFSCCYFFFFHRTTPTERIYIYMFVSERLTFGSFSGCQRNPIPRSARASRNEAALEFECPEEFGYYPHPRDCTQYYVCVFGGALLESCTGGLMYR